MIGANPAWRMYVVPLFTLIVIWGSEEMRRLKASLAGGSKFLKGYSGVPSSTWEVDPESTKYSNESAMPAWRGRQ